MMPRSDYYDVDGNPCSQEVWIQQFKDPETKFVAKTDVGEKPNASHISTVYLGLDHGYGDEPPMIFETMVFESGPLSDECVRYSTKEQTLAGHAEMVERVKRARDMRFVGL